VGESKVGDDVDPLCCAAHREVRSGNFEFGVELVAKFDFEVGGRTIGHVEVAAFCIHGLGEHNSKNL